VRPGTARQWTAAGVVATLLAACGREAPVPGPPPAPTAAVEVPGAPPPLAPARIAALRSAVARQPTGAATLLPRARELAAWSNDLARRGQRVPADLLPTVAFIGAFSARVADDPLLAQRIDGWIGELGLHEDDARALGSVEVVVIPPATADAAAGLVAGGDATLEQLWHLGARGLAPGGSLLVVRPPDAGHGALQATAPDGAGYVHVEADVAGAVFSPSRTVVDVMRGIFPQRDEALLFRLGGAALPPGSTLRVTYGDRAGGGPGMRLSPVATDAAELPLYADFSGSGQHVTLPTPRFAIGGGPLSALSARAPSVVGAGETFVVAVRGEDRFGNRAGGTLPSLTLFRDDIPLAVLEPDAAAAAPDGPAPAGALAHLALRLDAPGVARLRVASADGALQADVNPVLVEQAPAERVYWGDLGARTALSGASGSPAALWRFARDDARLDFVVHAEPDVGIDDAEWAWLRSALAAAGATAVTTGVQAVRGPASDMDAAASALPGESPRPATSRSRAASGLLASPGPASASPGPGVPPGTPAPLQPVLFLGYQWTQASTLGGYRNVVFRTPDRRERLSSIDFPAASDLLHALRSRYAPADVLVSARATEAADYRMADPDFEGAVEIASMAGSFEWFAQAWLRQGHDVGFVAASDDGFARPGLAAPLGDTRGQLGGLTAVRAAAGTRDVLFDALKRRSTYATTGARMLLEFTVNGVAMGQRAPFASRRALRGRVLGTAPVQSVTVLRNGEPVWQRDYLSAASGDGRRDATFLVEFSSPSAPAQRQDNPRGWRHWRGEMKVAGARLVDVRGIGFRNARLQRWIVDSERRDRAQFGTLTRGGASVLEVTLADISPGARIAMTLDPAMETSESLALYRRARLVDPVDVELRLAGLRDGVLAADVAFDGYADRVTLRRVDTPVHDVAFAVDDTGARHGDSYYVRVQQADGALAWSSPIRVGGVPPR
jgi:hypothetical protein